MKYLLDLKNYYPIDVKAAKAKWDELMNAPNNIWADMDVDRHLKIINDPEFPGTLRVIQLNTLPALLIRIIDIQKQNQINMKSGIELIADERQRQIDEEGYSKLEDATFYKNNELYLAACCYFAAKRVRAINGEGFDPFTLPNGWPWDAKHWKPSPDNRIRELQKAGALYMAQYDVSKDAHCLSQRDLCAAEINDILFINEVK